MKPIWIALALLPGMAGAEEWALAGHKVQLEELAEGGYRLTADGKVMLEDWQVFADEAAEIPGGALIYGSSGPGGNACAAPPFVLWLPEGGMARLDGPADTCSYLEGQRDGDRITWASEPVPGEMTESWIWTAKGGLVAGPSSAFAPDPGRGWEALPELADQHPAEAMRLQPVYEALKSGLGDEFPDFAERISGLGSGGLVGPDYYGEACIKETCDIDMAALWLDAGRREAFAFWRVAEGGELRLYPADRALWPEGALAKLAEAGG